MLPAIKAKRCLAKASCLNRYRSAWSGTAPSEADGKKIIEVVIIQYGHDTCYKTRVTNAGAARTVAGRKRPKG